MKRNLFLSPDAAEGVDPLDVNCNDIDTSYPILPASQYLLKINGAKVVRNKRDTGDVLVVPLQTIEKVQDKRGEDVQPGHMITHQISLEATENYPPTSIAKGLALLAKAAQVSATPRQIMSQPSLLDGKTVRAKVKVNKETAEFPESNSIGGFAAA